MYNFHRYNFSKNPCIERISHWKNRLLNSYFGPSMKKMITVHISSVKFKLSNFLLNPSKLVKPEETEVCQYLLLFTLIMDSHMTQCPRTDLNKRSLPRPKTTTAWKLIPYRSKITKNWNPPRWVPLHRIFKNRFLLIQKQLYIEYIQTHFT